MAVRDVCAVARAGVTGPVSGDAASGGADAAAARAPADAEAEPPGDDGDRCQHAAPDTSVDEPRQLTDPRELRAVTHPVRLSLLEVLGLHGALTATEAGELIGESPTTCSFHLRQLSKYGFVEEAGGGAGRRRPWQVAARGMRFSPKADDPEMAIAASALESLLLKRWMDRYGEWERTRHLYSSEWQEASEVSETFAYVTPEELTDLTAEILALIRRFESRITEPATRPDGSRPIEMVMFAFPFDVLGMGRDPSRRPVSDGSAPPGGPGTEDRP